MRMSARTAGLLVTVIALTAGVSVWITQLLPSRSEVSPGVPLTEPVTRDISAELGWQNTGILLEAGKTMQIQFMSGEVRDGDAILRGPAGAGYVCGDRTCCEPMPEAPRDALIGRVVDHLFLIGDKNTIEVREGGELQLRINDCDEGLFDNSGSLTVKISP